MVHEVEDGCEDFVHTLDVADFWVEFGVDEEDAGHYVVVVGDALEVLVGEELVVVGEGVAGHHAVFLLAGACQKWDHYWLALHTEKCQVGMRPRRILFDLFPQEKVTLKFLPSRRRLLQHQWIVLILLQRKECFDQVSVHLFVGFDDRRPFITLLREIPEKNLPADSTDTRGLVGDAFVAGNSQVFHVYDGIVEDFDESVDFLSEGLRKRLNCKLF